MEFLNDAIVKSYLSDPNVDTEKRKRLAVDLDSGKVNVNTIGAEIIKRYGEDSPYVKSATNKFMGAVGQTAGNLAVGALKGKNLIEKTALKTLSTPKQEILDKYGVDGQLPWKDVSEIPAEARQEVMTPEAYKETVGPNLGERIWGGVTATGQALGSGVLRIGEGLHQVGAGISGDTSGLEGYRLFYGLKKPEEIEIKQDMTPEERSIAIGQGLIGVPSGIVKGAFSPLAAIPGAIPETKPALETVGKGIDWATTKGADVIGYGTEALTGVPLSEEQKAAVKEGVGTITDLVGLKLAKSAEAAKAANIAKAGYAAQAKQLINAGDLAGASKALQAYEAAVKLPQARGLTGMLATTSEGTRDLTKGALTQSGEALQKLAQKPGIKQVVQGLNKVDELATKFTTKSDEMLKNAIQGTKKTVGTLKDTAFSKSTGLDLDSIKALKEANPTFIKQLKESLKKPSEELMQKPFETLKKVTDETKITRDLEGQVYSSIRNQKKKIGTVDEFFNKTLQENKIPVVNGKLQESSIGKIRDTGHLNQIQSVLDRYKGKNLTPEEFLNLRNDLDVMAKWDGGKHTPLQDWAKSTREQLNSTFRNKIKGLEAADMNYSKAAQDWKNIRGLIYDAQGNLKDSALNAANQLMNPSKSVKLNKIKDILGETNYQQLADQIKMAKLVKDIEKASGIKVGTYSRTVFNTGTGGAAAFGLYSGNLPLAAAGLAGQVLSHPKVFAKLMLKKAEGSIKAKAVVQKIVNKVEQGKTLAAKELQLVNKTLKNAGIFDNIQKGVEFIKQKAPEVVSKATIFAPVLATSTAQ